MSQKAKSRKNLFYQALIGGLMILIIAAIISCFYLSGTTDSTMSGECATSEAITTTNGTAEINVALMRRGIMSKDTKATTAESTFTTTTTTVETASETVTTSTEEQTTTTGVSTTEIKTTTTHVSTTTTKKTTTTKVSTTTKSTTTTKETTATEKVTTTIQAENETSSEESAEGPDVVRTLYATGYCKDSCGGNDKTAYGQTASVWHTIATYDYPEGTRIYIPAFKDKPNGGWFVVEDTGVSEKIDIWMASVSECYAITGSYECHIYY